MPASTLSISSIKYKFNRTVGEIYLCPWPETFNKTSPEINCWYEVTTIITMVGGLHCNVGSWATWWRLNKYRDCESVNVNDDEKLTLTLDRHCWLGSQLFTLPGLYNSGRNIVIIITINCISVRSQSANCNNSRHNSSHRIMLIYLCYILQLLLQSIILHYIVTAGPLWNNNGLQFVVREELQLRISGLFGERLFSITGP